MAIHSRRGYDGAMDAERMWRLMLSASDELADDLELEEPRFDPARAMAAVDEWLAHAEPLDEEDAARLGLFLARVLVEAYGGGLVQIRAAGHALDGEWAVSGFEQGLARDYHVPFVVAAVRIGVDRTITARALWKKLKSEGA
jgi:hypothetical protein